jgi:Kef-type K+ transport system membrane component KefB
MQDLVTILLLLAFMGIRTRIDLMTSGEPGLMCGLIVLMAVAGKFGGVLVAARTACLHGRLAEARGVLMNTRGLVELVVLNIGFGSGGVVTDSFCQDDNSSSGGDLDDRTAGAPLVAVKLATEGASEQSPCGVGLSAGHNVLRSQTMTERDHRPDPDILLARVQADEAASGRGKLQIFFVYAAGVSKTYAMLQAARRERADGVDVVVGYVETQGRPETEALLEGLEILLPLLIDYKGITLREFALDTAMARRPQLLLADVLAHTNAPGLRHAKRW